MSDLSRPLDRLLYDPRLILTVVGVVTVVGVLLFTRWASAPDWVSLARGGNPEEVARIADRLDEEGIRYRLDLGGTGLSVATRDMARARVSLARDGIAGSTRPGFELFDQPTWGMTDFTQRINYRRALEGELERTISRMRGVEQAQVHLGLHESALQRRGDRPTEASVVVRLRPGSSRDGSLAEGIAALVAGSVDGLDPTAVRIMDDTGRLLTDTAGEDLFGGRLSDQQLRVRREVEDYLERKAEELLIPVVGMGNLSIRVAAELDFDRVERTVQAVDPERQVTLREDRSEIIPGNQAQGAGQVTTTSTFEATRSVESFARSGVRIDRLSVAVLVGHRTTEGEEGPMEMPRDEEELARIEALVTQAVGLKPDRGDQIAVTNLPFQRTALPLSEPPAAGVGDRVVHWVQLLERPLVGAFGLGIALLLGLKVLSAVRNAPVTTRAGAGERTLPAGPSTSGGDRVPAPSRTPEAAPPPRMAAAAAGPEPVRLEDPEMTARLLRSWMKES